MDFLSPFALPCTQPLAATAKINKNPMNTNASTLFADTVSLLKIIVLISWPLRRAEPGAKDEAEGAGVGGFEGGGLGFSGGGLGNL